MRPPCVRCGTPLGSTDTACPACGMPVAAGGPATGGPAAGGGRRPLLGPPADGPPAWTSRPAAPTAGLRPSPRDTRPPRPGRDGGPIATGTVTGEPTCTVVPAIGPGRRLLVQAAAVAAVVVLLVAVVVVRHLPGLVLLVTGLAPVVLQGAVRALRPRGDRSRPDEPEHVTERWRFRVVEPSGRAVDCALTGRLSGPIRRGDVVEVYGRPDRQGTVRVRELVVVADQRPVRGRQDAGFLLTRAADVATLALAVLAVVAAVVTVVA